MPQDRAPQPVTDLAEARAAARRARDWTTADRLRGEIEAAGWRVVDAGTLYDLERAVAENVVAAGTIHYGSSAAVPSRLHEAPVGTASVVLLAGDRPDAVARSIRGLVDHAPDGTQLIVVAGDPAEGWDRALQGLDETDPGAPGVVTEVVRTRTRLGHAAALNAGIRRAAAPVVVLLDTEVELLGDLVSALVSALADDAVAVAGPFGVLTGDLQRFEPASEQAVDVAAISGEAIAFRRADYVAHGPLDEHFLEPGHLDTWWSLVLRDQAGGGRAGGDEGARMPDAASRRAVQAGRETVVRRMPPGTERSPDAGAQRETRRNFYRVVKRFATRRDLAMPAAGGLEGTRTPG